MGLSPSTVEHYLNAVKLKLNCNTRAELIAKALQMRIVLPYPGKNWGAICISSSSNKKMLFRNADRDEP
jgi:hypothetical protein